ncbi:MAG TPA: FG-GAP-like repeat-containing protein [Opitutaceae bacterium]|nr:FG-GAP-like repeat-containing protein [Opitutaceae bacterium]
MFTLVTPEESGVRTENFYADPKMWGELYQEFLFGAIGTGVAIGDYDGDGRPDIFVVSKTESCRLFRNLGNWKFEDATEHADVGDKGPAAAVWKNGVTFADVNNDGRLDIYVCRFNAPNLLYINQGDGTFKEMARAYGLDIKDCSGMASFCDYDRDGWLDVYIATNLLDSTRHPAGQHGYLRHNNRDGTFTDATEQAGIAGEACSHSATWWDYNNDGWPDLYVANDYGAPDKLYRNNGDGTFTDVIARVVPHTAYSSMGSDLGDVNNDGLIDFFVADMAATTHEKDQRSEADLRGREEEPPDSALFAHKYRRNALLLNTGTDRCLEGAFLAGIAATDWTWSARWEDLDNDGALDLFVLNGMNREQNIDVNARMMRAESTAERIRIMRESPPLIETHLAFRNLGDLKFKNISAAWGLDQKGIGFGAAFGDLDGDGDLDLVYSNYQGGVTLLRNDSDTGHSLLLDLRGTTSNRFGIGATVRIETTAGSQVRQLWLARGYMSSSEPAVHFGLGRETKVLRAVVTWPNGREQDLGALTGDKRYTVTEAPGPINLPRKVSSPRATQFSDVSQSTNLSWMSLDDRVEETAQQRLLPFRLNRRGPALAVGDLKDEEEDAIVIGGTTLDAVRLLVPNAEHRFEQSGAAAFATDKIVDDGPVLLFDANGDGKNDLLVTKGGNTLPAGAREYQPRLFLNDGHGAFAPAGEEKLPTLSISAGAAAAADFDRDGRLDVFIGARVLPGQHPSTPRSALLANRGEKFEDVTDTFAPGLREVGMVTSALWSDVDGDGWPDLLVAVEWGNVKCFHNRQGRGLEDWTAKLGFAGAGTGWWTSLASADFNGDGRPDFVAGNVGLNTQYHADAIHPAVLFYGEFGGDDDGPEIVEAYYEGDRLYPWRSRRDLGAAIKSVLKRFPRNDAYARASLGEILGEDRLAAAQRFQASELRSGVFLSQRDGTFVFSPLPHIAQIAPLQGIAAGDFDGDGRADIYAVQNSYAPVPAVGRFDGGLSQFLRGDGRGHFQPVSPAKSGLVLPGDAKALVAIDLDRNGWPDFVATRNNGPTVAFRNEGVAGRHSLGVRLRGLRGNPTAIGARVILGLTDGSSQTQEIAAGAGYYSQSTPECFFGWVDSAPPQILRVRWPDGAVSEHNIPPSTTQLMLAHP